MFDCQVVAVVSPSTGRRTRNTSIALRLNFSEPLSSLRVGGLSVDSNMSARSPSNYLVINTSREGTFSIELFAVDLAGNVQLRPTAFTWTTDTCTF